MTIFLTVLHLMACLVLILVVLLQRGKGADMGAMLGGGGANTVFGSRGAGNFLTKTTAACAVIFMLTSLSQSYVANMTGQDLIFDDSFADEPLPESGLEEIPGASGGELEEIPAETGGGLEEIPSAAADAADEVVAETEEAVGATTLDEDTAQAATEAVESIDEATGGVLEEQPPAESPPATPE